MALLSRVLKRTFVNFSSEVVRKSQRPSDLERVLLNAETLVGRPSGEFFQFGSATSEATDRVVINLLNDVLAPNSPFAQMIRYRFHDGHHGLRTKSTLTLLFSLTSSSSRSISPRQRSLSSVTEMVLAAFALHSFPSSPDDRSRHSTTRSHSLGSTSAVVAVPKRLLGPNEMVILLGDYFLARLLVEAANIRCQKMYRLVSLCLSDGASGHFDLDSSDRPVTEDSDQDPVESWETRTRMISANILGRSFQSAADLAGHCPEQQERAEGLGHSLAFALQLSGDLCHFRSWQETRTRDCPQSDICLSGALVAWALRKDPKLVTVLEDSQQDFLKALEMSVGFDLALLEVKNSLQCHVLEARKELMNFKGSVARDLFLHLLQVLLAE